MKIDGNTRLIAHVGHPTHSFKSPLIYNPWLAQVGANVVVVPFDAQPPAYPALLRALFSAGNVAGALITMPHKISTLTTPGLLDRALPRAQVAGACNAVRRAADGCLEGEMFDGEGFVRGMQRHGVEAAGRQALVVGCGGVGSAIAASLAAAGIARLVLADVEAGRADALVQRLRHHHPGVSVQHGPADAAGFDVIVNATPLGMNAADPLPLDVGRISPDAFVGDVVLTGAITPFLAAAQQRGCRCQPGLDMLFEQIPAYLEFFGLPVATAAQLRAVAALSP
ncbi:MAG: shikimate dehydrogenase [Lautropia sp.]|nr:shikimate dehydrogenase [Lautropia sp.]